MSAHPTTSNGPAPQRRTAVSRGLIKIVLITFIVVVLGFVLVRRIAGIAPESAAEARAKKEEQERAAKEAGNPFAVQRLIADQLRDRLARNDDEAPPRSQAPAQPPAAEASNPTPTRTEADAKRIEDHRNTTAVAQQEDLSGIEIGFWEAQDQDEPPGSPHLQPPTLIAHSAMLQRSLPPPALTPAALHPRLLPGHSQAASRPTRLAKSWGRRPIRPDQAVVQATSSRHCSRRQLHLPTTYGRVGSFPQ